MIAVLSGLGDVGRKAIETCVPCVALLKFRSIRISVCGAAW